MNITPTIDPSGRGYRITFRHPLLNKLVARGLGTREDLEAHAVCRDIEALCRQPQILQAPYSPELRGYLRRAVEIMLGEDAAEEIFKDAGKPFTADDIVDIRAMHEEADAVAKLDARDVGVRHTREDVAEYFAKDFMGTFTPRAWRQIKEYVKKLETELKVLRPRCEYLEAEYARVLRLQNAKVKARIADAFDQWKPIYKQHRSERTHKRAMKALESFIESLPEKGQMKVGEIRAGHIDAWVATLKKDDGKDLAAPTKLKDRNFLSVFFRWATKKYDLIENPLAKVDTIPGAQRAPDHIVAIRRLDDLRALIDGLAPWPYWQAWVATAIFAGPRFKEQCWLKLDDVFLGDDGDYLRVRTRTSGRKFLGSTKTGRERNVPLERTTLLPILKAHFERRRQEQIKENASVAEKSPWLFPTSVPSGPIERKKSQIGMWSDNRIFLTSWQRVAVAFTSKAGLIKLADKDSLEQKIDKLAALAGTAFEYWTYGPAEWRHCFGTALGNCGWNSLEISRMMGNSPDVAERHYIASASMGKRWPFEW